MTLRNNALNVQLGMTGTVWLMSTLVPLMDREQGDSTVTQEVTELGSEPIWVEGTEGRQDLPGSGGLGFEQAQLRHC